MDFGYQAWANNAQTKREERYDANMEASLILPFESWQLVWQIRAVNISRSGVLCRYELTDQSKNRHALDISTLLDAEPHVHLQINSQSDDLFSPSIEARMVRKLLRPHYLELAFTFNHQSSELDTLIESFIQRTDYHSENSWY